MRRTSAFGLRTSAFTLVELLVVIGIIALLIGILFPTIRKMRIAGQEADTKSFLNQIDQACQAYYLDHQAYPGPLSNIQLVPVAPAPVDQVAFYSGFLSGTTLTAVEINPGTQQITSSENLLLGLMGGLELNRTGTGPATYFSVDALGQPNTLGQGPSSLNSLKVGRTNAYLSTSSRSNGRLRNAFSEPMDDTVIPEFVDRFTGGGEVQDLDNAATPVLQPYRIGGMPILYLRSHRNGRSALGPIPGVTNPQSLVSFDPMETSVDFQLREVAPYTMSSVGGGRESDSSLAPKYKGRTFDNRTPHGLQAASATGTTNANPVTPGLTYQYPFDGYDYFVDPSSYDRAKTSALTAAEVAAKRTRKKDSYVLISAGRDRIYGTEDDITNFGSVLP